MYSIIDILYYFFEFVVSLTSKQLNLLYIFVTAICFLPYISPAIALFIGLLFAYLRLPNKSFSQYKTTALQASIVLMGFGISLTQVINTSKTGFTLTVISVISTLLIGLSLAKLFKVDKNTGILISSGTAICGGSAIAAIAPVINAKDSQITFSLVVIFVLNAIALFIFPTLGHILNLSQETFGFWAAIAIHDTSSVVGAGAAYGTQALEIATIVKLTRALWIIPLSLFFAFMNKDSKHNKVSIPWFILYFVIAIFIAYLLPQFTEIFSILSWLGKKGMVLALFFIGSNMSIAEAKLAGTRSFMLGISLWFVISTSTLILLNYL